MEGVSAPSKRRKQEAGDYNRTRTYGLSREGSLGRSRKRKDHKKLINAGRFLTQRRRDKKGAKRSIKVKT